jgi:CubicO group peptidase (beta-lactamase class C family)
MPMRESLRVPFLALLPWALCVLAAVAPAQFVPDVVSYLGVSASAHQTQWTTLSGQGYRPISLSVAGSITNQSYTAVWIRRSGAGYTGVHGVDRATYESWAQTQRNAGRRPYLVTAAGSVTNQVYAGVYMADGVDAVEETNVSGFNSRNTWARDNGYVQTCVGRTDTGFCGVWERTAERTYAACYNSTDSEFQADFDAHVSAHQRLAFVRPGPASHYASYTQIYRNDSIGGWVCIPGLTQAQMLTEIGNRRPSGAYPICLQQWNTGSSARYTAIFADRDRPQTRVFTATGTSNSYFADFDDHVEDRMRTLGIRQSALAVTRHGRLVYARGYTLAEPNTVTTQPTTMFRIASCSKVISGLMANLLVQRGGTIAMSTRVANYLGLSPVDARLNNTTVLQTIQHRSGVLSDMNSWSIANFRNPSSPTLPQNAWSNALYLEGSTLAYAPGTTAQYSNAGYYLLGEVIARASGRTYEQYLREELGTPHDITRLWVANNLASQRRSGEAEYHNRELQITPSQLHTDRRVLPIQYGGDGDDNMDRRAAAGGVLTSPVDYLRLLSGCLDLGRDGGIFLQARIDEMLAAPPSGTTTACGFDNRTVRPNGVVSWTKNGALWGNSSRVIYRSDGVAIALFHALANCDPSENTLNNLADDVAFWTASDHFPTYGLPAFSRSAPRIDSVDRTTIPNVTNLFVTIEGELLSGVDRVSIGSTDVTSLFSWNPANGWFRRVSDRVLELHLPQGMMPGSYDVVLRNGIRSSRSFPLSITRATSRLLVGPDTTPLGYDLVCSRGGSSTASMFYLGFSTSTLPSLIPGTVSLGIGNQFTDLGTAGPFNPSLLTGAARIAIPDLGAIGLHFQVAMFDPNAINTFPLPVSNVKSVQGL